MGKKKNDSKRYCSQCGKYERSTYTWIRSLQRVFKTPSGIDIVGVRGQRTTALPATSQSVYFNSGTLTWGPAVKTLGEDGSFVRRGTADSLEIESHPASQRGCQLTMEKVSLLSLSTHMNRRREDEEGVPCCRILQPQPPAWYQGAVTALEHKELTSLPHRWRAWSCCLL